MYFKVLHGSVVKNEVNSLNSKAKIISNVCDFGISEPGSVQLIGIFLWENSSALRVFLTMLACLGLRTAGFMRTLKVRMRVSGAPGLPVFMLYSTSMC